MAKREKRTFNMHPKMLLDVIQRQAGTFHKAILEGTMNAIEAGATAVHLGYNDEEGEGRFTIKDDGQGIASRSDIERFFETFGTPHEESEDKTWAQFRMGRGQMFSFGHNIWRTGKFLMDVDIKERGLDWWLEDGHKNHHGCDIDIQLYMRQVGQYHQYSSVEAFRAAIKEQIEFVGVPTYFNGEQLNTPPEGLDWDVEDDDAYYKFGVGTDLSVYNLGVFVMKIPSWRAGVSGIVVSKRQLKVNFARNDVQSDCEVYKRINKVVRDNRVKRTVNRRAALSDSERIATLADIRDGYTDMNGWERIGLLRTVAGNIMKFDDMRKLRQPWCFGESGDRRGDRVMQMETGTVLDDNIKSQLRYDGDDSRFFTWLLWAIGLADDYAHLEKLHRDFDTMVEGIHESYRLLRHKELRAKERYVLRALSSYDVWDGRVLSIGISATAEAWTDGETYIAIDRDFLNRCNLPWSSPGTAKLCSVLTHEMAHDTDTAGSHLHGPEFYERFHQLCMSFNSPLSICSDLHKRLAKAKTMIKQEKEEKQAKRQRDRRNAALGVAASPK